MAARHTVIQTVIYSITQLYRKLKKRKKHINNMTQITSPQTWQMSSKSVLLRQKNHRPSGPRTVKLN